MMVSNSKHKITFFNDKDDKEFSTTDYTVLNFDKKQPYHEVEMDVSDDDLPVDVTTVYWNFIMSYPAVQQGTFEGCVRDKEYNDSTDSYRLTTDVWELGP